MQRPALRLRRRVVSVFGALLLIAALTAFDFKVIHVNGAAAAFTYLLAILALSTRYGFDAAIAASFAGALCYNFFFLPPVGAFTIADPQNWVALIVFLVTGVTAARLSASARKQADEAQARREEMERMYAFSRALLLTDETRGVGTQVAQRASQLFGIPETAFYESSTDRVYRSGPLDGEIEDAKLRAAAGSGRGWSDDDRIRIEPISIGGHTLGSLGVAGTGISHTALQAVAQLSGIALAQVQARELATRTESARQNERLKSTLLDAVAHEFKTPLTSVKAAVTTLLTSRTRDAFDQELLTVIDEEADHLTRLVTEAIELSRISAGEVTLRPEPVAVQEILNSALEDMRPYSDGHEVRFAAPADGLEIVADPKLVAIAVRQVLDNARKYAAPGTPIAVTVARTEELVQVDVVNEGPGIPERDQERLFEKFYRGSEVRQRTPGSGLGLNIAREIIEAHGGQLTLRSEADRGVTVSMTLPIAGPPVRNA